MTEAPEPFYRRRTPPVTEETPGPGYTCPTACDSGCEAICHEGHQVPEKRMHPVEICEANSARGKRPIPEGWYPKGCSCYACDGPFMPTFKEFAGGIRITADTPRPPLSDDPDDENMRVSVRMSLCPVCGFKRCPGAADHRNRCTGSNKTGQPGSLYPEPVDEGEKRQRQEEALQELHEVFAEEHEAQAGHPLADTPIHTRGPLEGQPIKPETEQERRERYLANRDDPEEWG